MIVRICTEDSTVCVPVDKYCDRMADCPLVSDEADCSCTDLHMHECTVKKATLCIFEESIMHDEMDEIICQNGLKQDGVNQPVLGNLGKC